MVEMVDGSVIAEMAIADMSIPVAFALAYPERLNLAHLKPLSLVEQVNLAFEEPDLNRFPCLRLGYDALRAGGTMAACLNAANEELVAGFLAGHTRFIDIPCHLETVMARHRNYEVHTLEELLEADQWARLAARELISSSPRRVWA